MIRNHWWVQVKAPQLNIPAASEKTSLEIKVTSKNDVLFQSCRNACHHNKSARVPRLRGCSGRELGHLIDVGTVDGGKHDFERLQLPHGISGLERTRGPFMCMHAYVPIAVLHSGGE